MRIEGSKRIGIYGGTFDPVHEAHVFMGLSALAELKLDRVFYVPSCPWQKTAKASGDHRRAMLELALKNHRPRLLVDSRELERGGPSYSIETLESFRRECGARTPVYFIMGSDQWKNLTTWVRWETFPELVNFLIFTRDRDLGENPYGDRYPIMTTEEAALCDAPHGIIALSPTVPQPFSSTSVRAALSDPRSRRAPITGLSEEIRQYILENNLYFPLAPTA